MADTKFTKNICFVTTVSRTVNMFLLPQFDALMDAGWKVTVVCAEDPESPLKIPPSVRYQQMPFKRGVDMLSIPRALYLLYKLFKSEQFDIVQYSNPNAAFCASIAAALAGVKVRLYAQWGIRYVGFTGPVRKIFKLVEKITCVFSTVIEPDSHSNLVFSIKEGLYPELKGRVIGNGSACGIDTSRFDCSCKEEWRREYRQRLDIDDKALVIGFLGTLRRDKGANELLQACRDIFKKRSNVILLAVGYKTFYESIDKELWEWFESSQQVIYVPPTNDVPQHMACMDIFTLPSYREGFGLVIVEAEAMGVPVVVSDVPGPIDAMINGETGLIVPVKDATALQRALEKMLDDPSTRQSYGKRAASFVQENFERTEFFRKVLADKESLLEKVRES